MRNAVKEKVTLSIDRDLVSAVDHEVSIHHADSRSAVVEGALRLWHLEQRRRAIEAGVERYYRSQSVKEKREDRSWSRFAIRSAKRLWDE